MTEWVEMVNAAVRTVSQWVSWVTLDMQCVLCDVQHGVYMWHDMALTGSNTLDVGLITPQQTLMYHPNDLTKDAGQTWGALWHFVGGALQSSQITSVQQIPVQQCPWSHVRRNSVHQLLYKLQPSLILLRRAITEWLGACLD